LKRATNVVRIIGGEHRGRKLNFVPIGGLRPTPDRVRETLFNWLRDDIRGARCLDLFAGSGALGFEALSRGAASLTAVEQNRAAYQRLRDNAGLLRVAERVTLLHADALKVIQSPPERPFDIVFLDPPFADRRLGLIGMALDSAGWVGDGGLVYLEQDGNVDWPEHPPAWQVLREGRTGQSAQRLLRCSIQT
jgi:16S rRNA (guanine966-N2)-methyltransferase